jgi:hypothetical protein
LAEDVHLFGPNGDPATKLAHHILITIFIPGALIGFALVLWSRLHLMTSNTMLLRGILTLIILVGTGTSLAKIIGFWRASTTIGYRILRAGMYLTIGMNSVEISIMVIYIASFWRFLQPTPWKDPATVRIGLMLVAAICYVLVFAASCVTTQMVGLYDAHAIVSLGFAFKLWIEFLILMRIVDFSSKTRKEAEALSPPLSFITDETQVEKGLRRHH